MNGALPAESVTIGDPALDSPSTAVQNHPDLAKTSKGWPLSETSKRASGVSRKVYGTLCSLPFILLMLFGFIVPLLCVVGFGLMPSHTFSLLHLPTFDNYRVIFTQSYVYSLLKSTGLALVTVGLLLVICYPLAFALAKVFHGGATFVTYAIASSLFVSENIRLFGWVIGLMKGGVLGGLLAKLGLPIDSFLYNVPVIVLGMVYVYLPFMLFPLALGLQMVPQQVREAAYDMGASRWQVFRMIDLPLSLPGIMIGSILVFVLSIGAMAEAKILGGQKIVTIAAEIETAFTFGQNWPLGSALATLLIGLTMVLVFSALKRVDLEKLLGRRTEA